MVVIVAEENDPPKPKPFDIFQTPFQHPVFIREKKSKIFPSMRFLFAFMLSVCFIALSVSTSNLAQSMVCMVQQNKSLSTPVSSNSSWSQAESNSTQLPCTTDDDVTVTHCSERGKLKWSSTTQGFIFAAQNFGTLLMVISGTHVDRLNGKWVICFSLMLLIISNSMIPLVAPVSPWLVFVFRMLVGTGDALLFPSASSLITRWFPPKERPFALGFVTGGRQLGAVVLDEETTPVTSKGHHICDGNVIIGTYLFSFCSVLFMVASSGTLIILPIAGVLCESPWGWPSIFYLSSIIVSAVLILWVLLAADKPSKHICMSQHEETYINSKIEEEKLGKRNERGRPPLMKILTSRPLLIAIAALVCHEYPLVIMLQFLPKFFSDILGLSNAVNGLVSALPAVVLFLSKTLSSSLASLLTARKPPLLGMTNSCRIFNLIASLGLAICLGVTPLLGKIGHPAPAIIVLCLANAFAGLHTPGVQTALVQLAPAYSGIVTAFASGVVACSSIINKLTSSYILATGSTKEWTIVFEISALVALLPVVFFTLWGSADVQPWAANSNIKKKEQDQVSSDTVISTIASSRTNLTPAVK